MWTLLAAAAVFMGRRTGRTQSEFQRRYSHLNTLLLHSRLVSTPAPTGTSPANTATEIESLFYFVPTKPHGAREGMTIDLD